MSYDIVIREGRIVDGSGAESYRGDIAIEGDTIVAIGKGGRQGSGDSW